MQKCIDCRRRNTQEAMQMNKIKQYFSNFQYATQIILTASKKYFILKLILSLISSVLPYLPLFLWRNLINALVEALCGNSEALLKTIWRFAACYGAVILIEKLIAAVSEYVVFKYNDAINYYLDNLMVEKVSGTDLSFFDSSDLQDKLSNSWWLIYSMKNMVTFVFDIIQNAVRLCISFSLMLSLSHWLIPVVILMCIPYVIGNKKANDIEYRFKKDIEKPRRKLEYYKSLFFESSRQEIRLYDLKDYFRLLYENVWEQWNKGNFAVSIKKGIISTFALIVLAINEIIVYGLAVSKLIIGEIAVGDVAYYISILSQFRSDFSSLCNRITMFERNSKEISDVREFVEMKPNLEKSGTKIPSQHPRIEFRNVSFKYPNSETYVLKDCSFVIERGQTIGLVGLNGSGKSTIVKLLCRFYDPTEGIILIDGIDSREYDIAALRKCFGVMFQDFVRYSFSLRENVALSDLSALDDDGRIKKACISGRVTDFIGDWENGIDENLTRRFDSKGKELSGGQWQRICLARTFFRNAPIILLDEPSASLDPIAEHEIFKDFAAISKDKSAVLISHRLSSITLADKILVLSDGYIIEQGTHDELLRQSGEYARLFNLQASKYAQ